MKNLQDFRRFMSIFLIFRILTNNRGEYMSEHEMQMSSIAQKKSRI